MVDQTLLELAHDIANRCRLQGEFLLRSGPEGSRLPALGVEVRSVVTKQLLDATS